VFAVAIGAAALAAGVEAWRTDAVETPLFGSGESGILVLDLSSSIDATTPLAPGAVLRKLAGSGGRAGLVLFSDVAYEALPTSASATELRSYGRFFRRPSQGAAARRRTIVSPWTGSFRGGTRISSGLELARRMIQQHPERGRGVVLVSDLNDSLFDIEALTAALARYRRDGIDLRVVPVGATPEDRALFADWIGEAGFVRPAELAGPVETEVSSSVPRLLVVFVALVAALLGLNELACARLDWRRR